MRTIRGSVVDIDQTKRRRAMWRSFTLLVLATCLLSSAYVIAQDQLPDPAADKVQLMSGLPAGLAAQQLGIDTSQGKPTDPSASGPPGDAKAPKLRDVCGLT